MATHLGLALKARPTPKCGPFSGLTRNPHGGYKLYPTYRGNITLNGLQGAPQAMPPHGNIRNIIHHSAPGNTPLLSPAGLGLHPALITVPPGDCPGLADLIWEPTSTRENAIILTGGALASCPHGPGQI